MVSFIRNGSEIRTWMGYSFKTKSTNSKQGGILEKGTSFFNLKLQDDQISTRTVVRQFSKTAVFITTPMKKHIQRFILPKGVFVNFFKEKLCV